MTIWFGVIVLCIGITLIIMSGLLLTILGGILCGLGYTLGYIAGREE